MRNHCDPLVPVGSDSPIARREFLQSTGLLSAALFTGLQTESALGYQANDTIRVACLGTGGRCRHLMKSLKEIPNVKITALCDLYDPHLAEAMKLAAPDAIVTKDYRELLDRKHIDAVLIASPDHWHVPMTIAACEAGKDVYVEKPLTHDLSEGAKILAAQEKSKRIVQIGTQQRSMPHIQKAREIIQSGGIGDVFKVHLTWNRNADRARRVPLNIDPAMVNWKAFLGTAPDQPFDEYRFRNWRWFWDFGGGILTDLMVHWIDVVHWILKLDHPSTAITAGNFHAAEGVWETPDTIQSILQYPSGVQAYFEGTFSNARNGSMVEFMGTDATLYMDRGRYEIHPERKKKVQPSELILGTGPRGADFYDKPDGEMLHLINWVECIRSKKEPSAPVSGGVSAASAAHLGNIAYRKGIVAKWDDHGK